MRDPFRLLGTAIENRYRIDEVIGEGGFGVVYRGHHTRLEHPVAVKCLKIPSHFTPEAKEIFLKRFREEGKILLKLADASGVPRIYDYGTHIGDLEIPYLVIEWLDGQTLEDMLKARRASKQQGLSGADAIALMLPAIEALAIAHRSQIAHRDIKPANLFLSGTLRGPVVKVLDFGIAKAMQEGETQSQSQTQTSTSFRAFTPNYAAPEQFAPKRHGASGPWTDVHALGLLLFEILTDKAANGGDEFVECLESAMSELRPSPQGQGAQISDELEAVVTKAVARSPDARYRDAGALAAALREVPEAKQGPSSEFATMVPLSTRTLLAAPLPEATSPPGVGGARTELAPDLFSQLTAERASDSGSQLGNERVELTKQRVSQPRIPELSTPRDKRSTLPLVLGAVLVVGGGAGALLWASGDIDEGAPGDASAAQPSSSSSAPTGKDEAPITRWAWSTEDHREIMATVETTEAEAKGKVHSRLTIENGKVTKAERLDPAGTVRDTKTVQYASDGSWQLTANDPWGDLVATTRLSKDGIWTRVSRSGSPLTNGCARFAMKFSPAGDELQRTCQDANGHVIIDVNGCQILAFEVNENHQTITQRCLLEGGKPIPDSEGVHLSRFSYDAKGRVTEKSTFGVDGSSVNESRGCARMRSEYDDAGNGNRERCFGTSGLPIAFRGSPVGAFKRTFDEHGCEVRTEYVDVDGRQVLNGQFWATVLTRNSKCSLLSSQTVDANGNLVGLIARFEQVHDEKGNITQKSCFDAKKLPISCDGQPGQDGAVMRYQYDERGRQVSSKSFDGSGAATKSGSGYPHENRSQYDEAGLVVESRYFDADGKPAAALGNVARRALRYDALGSEISTKSYGIDDAPVVPATGVHEIRRAYDDKHRLARIELRAVDGSYAAKPSIIITGVSWPDRAVRMEIVRADLAVKNQFFDKDDKEVASVDCSGGKPCHL